MAIGDLGERLSKSAARKHRKERKDRESWEKRAAVGSLLGPAAVSLIGEVGKSVLTATQSTFLNSEAVQAERARNASALRKVEAVYKTQREMDESGLGGLQYIYQQVRPVAATELDAETGRSQEGRHIQSGEIMSETWNEVVDFNAMEIAKEQFAAHQANMEAADKVVSMEQFDSMLASELKGVTPTTLSGAVVRWVANKFTGKTNEGRQQAVLEDIRQHHYLKSASSLERFDEAYKLTKNVRTARDWASLGDSIAEYVATDHVSHNNPGSQVMTIQDPETGLSENKEMTWNQEVYLDGTVGRRIYEAPRDLPGLEDPIFTRAQNEAYKNSLIAQWNPVNDVISLIGEDNYAAYTKGLLENETLTRDIGDGETETILPNNIKNGEEWKQVVDHFNRYIADNPELIISADEKFLQQARLTAYMSTDAFDQAADNLEQSGYYGVVGTPEFQKSLNYYIDIRSGREAGEKPDDYVEKYLPAIDAMYKFTGALENVGNSRRNVMLENPPVSISIREDGSGAGGADTSGADTSGAGADPRRVAQFDPNPPVIGGGETLGLPEDWTPDQDQIIAQLDRDIEKWVVYRDSIEPERVGVLGGFSDNIVDELNYSNDKIAELRRTRGSLAAARTAEDLKEWATGERGINSWSDVWDVLTLGPLRRLGSEERAAALADESDYIKTLIETRPDFVPPEQPVQVASVDNNIPK